MDHSRQTERVVLPTAIQSVTRPARCIPVDVAQYVLVAMLEAFADRMAAIRMVWKRRSVCCGENFIPCIADRVIDTAVLAASPDVPRPL
jgi:hypothetical protein